MPRYFEIVRDDGFVEVMVLSDIPDPKPIPDPVPEDDEPSEVTAQKLADVARRNAEAIAAAQDKRLAAPAEHLARWRSTGKTEVSFREITRSDIPTDRTFRAAWAPGMTVDMGKARAIHMDRIRKARDAAMLPLDVEFTKALGRRDNAKADAAEAKRQALRDLPSTFDLSVAKTPEELKALWPDELGERRGG